MSLSWKAVFLIWLLALPMLGGVGVILYQRHPAPFDTVAGWAKVGYGAGLKAYQDHQAKEAAKKAAAEAAAKKAAESTQAVSY